MNIKTIALAATIAAAPFAASATTLVVGGGTGTYLLGGCVGGADLVIGDVTADGGAGSHSVNFEACAGTIDGLANASVTVAVGTFGFSGLTVAWSDGEGPVALTPGGTTTIKTSFDVVNPQDLIFAWTGSLKGSSFDYDVSAVPVPAGFLLLGTALAGLGLARRKA